MPRSGEVIDDRFTIEHLAGAGGMGQVYRARDRKTGGLVALKVMHDTEKVEIERFARETHVLATLSHPGIVRYIHSGATAEGEPYLVMEWLSGETLSARLQRAPISLAETLALGRRVASALGAIHRRGVVHRDIKPSNLFLRNNALGEVALIDFGMARRPVGDPKLTITGTMLGTPGYIAPEQVYNVPNLDGRADIFSLGCVLYRCISGRPPFHGFRTLLNGPADQLPRLRELRPSVPAALDDLVTRMLSRSPDDRPHNGDAVAAELGALEESEPAEVSSVSVRSGPRSIVSELMGTERRLMCLVMARPADRPASGMDRDAQDRALRAVTERYRGKLEVLADGTLLVCLSHADAATDLTARAARCALALRALLGNGVVVVVSGREVIGPSVPASELLDRAMGLLDSTTKGSAVRIDELTSALLENRFDTGRTGLHLRGELREPSLTRLQRGEPAVCVGREQELTQLETIFDQCVEDRAASMVLLTGAPGMGKSRLAQAFLHRLGARDQPMAIWAGESDAPNLLSSFGLIAQVLRRALGILDNEPIDVRRKKIREWALRHPEADGPRFAEILGELAGTALDAEPTSESGRVRRDTMSASERTTQTFLSFLRAECATQPVLIVLEDLHWGDLATIKLIDAALGALSDQPLMVLALARTKMHEIFPQLWTDRSVQEIRLRKLARRASEQLVRQALGTTVRDETLRALVERSEGHAFFLEQMIRAVADGRGLATPPSVLAMVQARIEKFDPAARRVLRAASVFGDTFWRGGVEALLGAGDTAAWLAELVEQDVIATRDAGRFPAEAEYRFRNTLVREAAYEMLTEGDRVAGHWLAGQWLEQAGETDAAILSDHFARCERGGISASR